MLELAILLRTLQLYAHNSHNLSARVVFLQDHDFFAEIYSEAEKDYDSVIERMIGIMGQESVDLNSIQMSAVQTMASLPTLTKENAQGFQSILEIEKEICQRVEVLVRQQQVTVGTEQMIGDIADRSEVRQYKLKQRLKK